MFYIGVTPFTKEESRTPRARSWGGGGTDLARTVARLSSARLRKVRRGRGRVGRGHGTLDEADGSCSEGIGRGGDIGAA
eukprot:1963866-Pyramimonas_sp.AAC.1